MQTFVNFIHMMPRGIKTGPNPWVTSWNQRNRDVESIRGENDSGERSRAIMALLFLKTVIFNFVYTLSSANIDQSAPNLGNIFMSNMLLVHIFYKWCTENLTKGPTQRTNFREKIYSVQNSFRIKTSEFTYRVLLSNIYRSLIGRLFFTLFTVAIMSDKRKQTILDFFGGK